MSKCITIYTDASVHVGVGGWGCWIKTAPGETSLHSGAFKSPVNCTLEAELMAIANGLAIAKKMNTGKDICFVIVTDSQAAIQYIDHAKKRTTHLPGMNRQKLKETAFKLAKAVLKLVPEDCELRVNKVKAHSSADGKRSYVNNLVDRASRNAMRKKRDA